MGPSLAVFSGWDRRGCFSKWVLPEKVFSSDAVVCALFMLWTCYACIVLYCPNITRRLCVNSLIPVASSSWLHRTFKMDCWLNWDGWSTDVLFERPHAAASLNSQLSIECSNPLSMPIRDPKILQSPSRESRATPSSFQTKTPQLLRIPFPPNALNARIPRSVNSQHAQSSARIHIYAVPLVLPSSHSSFPQSPPAPI